MQPQHWFIFLLRQMYKRMLKLYPPQFRSQYEVGMMQLFDDICRDTLKNPTCVSLLDLWLRITDDFIRSFLEQYWYTWKEMIPFMKSDQQILRTTSILLWLIATPSLLWALFFIGFHRNGLIASPYVEVHWSLPANFQGSDPIVYRAAVTPTSTCYNVPASDFIQVPQKTLRSGITSLETQWYTLTDRYRMQRGEVFCYRVEAVTDRGVAETIVAPKAAAANYDWAMITIALLGIIVSSGMIYLARRLHQLATEFNRPLSAI
jgi:hypothetical protein